MHNNTFFGWRVQSAHVFCLSCIISPCCLIGLKGDTREKTSRYRFDFCVSFFFHSVSNIELKLWSRFFLSVYSHSELGCVLSCWVQLVIFMFCQQRLPVVEIFWQKALFSKGVATISKSLQQTFLYRKILLCCMYFFLFCSTTYLVKTPLLKPIWRF